MVGSPLKQVILIIVLFFSGPWSYAQYEGDDVYDPFADYSEFEENDQEEADINFFRNGRFFNMAFLLGGRMFTDGMGQYIEASPSPGISLTYWFSLRLALQFSYLYSQHTLGPILLDITKPNETMVYGNMSVNTLAFDLKYYFNTSNITRGLADLNPFFLIGFSQNSRNFSIVDQLAVAKDNGAGLDVGLGIEIPISRNRMYLGMQFVYTYVNFANENNPLSDSNPPIYIDGDIMNAHLIFGFNFF